MVLPVILLMGLQIRDSHILQNTFTPIAGKLFGLSLRTTAWREYFVRPRGPKPDVALGGNTDRGHQSRDQ